MCFPKQSFVCGKTVSNTYHNGMCCSTSLLVVLNDVTVRVFRSHKPTINLLQDPVLDRILTGNSKELIEYKKKVCMQKHLFARRRIIRPRFQFIGFRANCNISKCYLS